MTQCSKQRVIICQSCFEFCALVIQYCLGFRVLGFRIYNNWDFGFNQKVKHSRHSHRNMITSPGSGFFSEIKIIIHRLRYPTYFMIAK